MAAPTSVSSAVAAVVVVPERGGTTESTTPGDCNKLAPVFVRASGVFCCAAPALGPAPVRPTDGDNAGARSVAFFADALSTPVDVVSSRDVTLSPTVSLAEDDVDFAVADDTCARVAAVWCVCCDAAFAAADGAPPPPPSPAEPAETTSTALASIRIVGAGGTTADGSAGPVFSPNGASAVFGGVACAAALGGSWGERPPARADAVERGDRARPALLFAIAALPLLRALDDGGVKCVLVVYEM